MNNASNLKTTGVHPIPQGGFKPDDFVVQSGLLHPKDHHDIRKAQVRDFLDSLDSPDPIDMGDFTVEAPPNKRSSKDYKVKGEQKLKSVVGKKPVCNNPLLLKLINKAE